MLTAIATYKLIPEKVRIEEKTVTEVQERVVVRTRIIERPDGTKETIIDERRDTDIKSETQKLTTPDRDWYISLSSSFSKEYKGDRVYTLGVQKKLLGRLSGGIYARSDKELGAMLSYSF